MFAHALRLALVVAVPVLIQPCVGAETTASPARSPKTASPAYVGTTYKQETVATTCTKFTSDGAFWSCWGVSTKVGAGRLLLVQSIGCRSDASGGLLHTQVDIRHGTGVGYDWTDFITVPMVTTFSLSGLVFQGATIPTTYAVPAGHRIAIEGALTGTPMSGAELSCTITGRFATP